MQIKFSLVITKCMYQISFLEEESCLLPYLGAEDVLDEVVTLLARLENDRLETLQGLHNEKDRVVKLNEKIDHLCLVRMRELPIAVQKGIKTLDSLFCLSHVKQLLYDWFGMTLIRTWDYLRMFVLIQQKKNHYCCKGKKYNDCM